MEYLCREYKCDEYTLGLFSVCPSPSWFTRPFASPDHETLQVELEVGNIDIPGNKQTLTTFPETNRDEQCDFLDMVANSSRAGFEQNELDLIHIPLPIDDILVFTGLEPFANTLATFAVEDVPVNAKDVSDPSLHDETANTIVGLVGCDIL
jgi:hypothetical protein